MIVPAKMMIEILSDKLDEYFDQFSISWEYIPRPDGSLALRKILIRFTDLEDRAGYQTRSFNVHHKRMFDTRDEFNFFRDKIIGDLLSYHNNRRAVEYYSSCREERYASNGI